MKSKIRKILEVIVERLAIAFFFFCLVTTLVYFTSYKKVNYYIDLFNNFTFSPSEIKNDTLVDIDKETHDITHYPNYGEQYGVISIPAINVNVNLYHGDSLEILKKGAGHFSGSFFPSEGGTILIAAHNRENFFKYLPNLVLGDQIILKTTYGTFTYTMTSSKVMNASDLEKIEFKDNQEELVLYTCYPMNAIGLVNERFVVYASLSEVSYEK